MIHSRRRSSGDLTIHTVHGHVTAEDMRKVIEVFHATHPTRSVLWDFRQAEMTQLSTSDIEQLVQDVQRYAHTRHGEKTALVFAHDLGYGQGRMFQTYAALRETPVTFACFRAMADAEAWLDISSEPCGGLT